MALGFLALIVIGLSMTHLGFAPMTKFKLYQLHKSIGVTILLLALCRLGWRLTHRPPPLPDMPPLQRFAAEAGHVLLYALMLALPLTGWALVSASPLNLPTVLYGVIPWPHLPVPDDLERLRKAKWCPGAESNHRHCDFQSHALPTELPGLSLTAGVKARAL